MNNSIQKFKNYVDQLDDVYKLASLTAILDTPDVTGKMTKAGSFLVPKMEMDGLGDYKRSNTGAGSGYAKGNVTIEFEEKKADYDRGRKFEVDVMDDEETSGIAFGMLSSEFVRTKSVPEQDAYRFAKYANLAGKKVEGSLSDGAAVISALSAAISSMKEKEVGSDGLYLFITPTLYQAVKDMDSYKSKEALTSFAQIVEVPQVRFYTAISMKDGKKDDEFAGGFVKAESGKDINFMIIKKSAVLQNIKHRVNKIITPEANQDSDGWLFFFRVYGIVDVYDNKKDGLYLHHKAS